MTPLSFRPFFWEIRPLSIILATTGIRYLTSGWWWGHCSRNNVGSQPLIHSNILSKSHRDNPDSLPSFVGENEAKKGYIITQMGDNVFAAVLWVFPWKNTDCVFLNNKCIDSGPMYLLTMLLYIQNLFQFTPVEEEKRERCQKSWSRNFRKAGRTAEGTGRKIGLVFGPEVQSHEAAREEGIHQEGFYFLENQFFYSISNIYTWENNLSLFKWVSKWIHWFLSFLPSDAWWEYFCCSLGGH